MPDKILDAVRKKLGHLTMEWSPSLYLDTHIPELNCVVGDANFGVPYGQMIEIYGLECLVGDTLIECPRNLNKYPQGIPIKDLVGTKPWVYCYDQSLGRIAVRRASRVWKKGKAKVYKVTFKAMQNSRRKFVKSPDYIIATENHPFMLREISKDRSKFSPAFDWEAKGYRLLKDLKPGDRLMPLYRGYTTGGASCHINLNNGTAIQEHRFILSELQGERLYPEWGTHHKDEDHLNNEPTNLEWKTPSQHASHHLRKRNLERTTGWQKTGVHPQGMLGKSQTAKQREAASKVARRINAQGLNRPKRLRATKAEYLNHEVEKIEFYGYEDVYDMTVPDMHNFVANGVVVHNSAGKTAITLALAAFAQRDGAFVTWMDMENSFRSKWAIQRGILPCPYCHGPGVVTKAGEVNGQKLEVGTCPECGSGDNPCFACKGLGKFKNAKCPECLGTGKQRGLGVDISQFSLIQPYIGDFTEEKKGKKKVVHRLSNAQDLCGEAEAVIDKVSTEFSKKILIVDSIPGLLTEGEMVAGFDGRNMRTNMDLPMFLSSTMRRWIGWTQAQNVLVIWVNQMRQKPNAMFGDPWYTPGGNATRFFCHIRVKVRRKGVHGGRMTDKGEVIGIKGLMRAVKNKAGGAENAEVGYKIQFKGPIEFVPANEIAAGDDGEE